ncbi:MAG: hypothetical protein Tsb009_16060 [Planctomycetaceae bacterium]
MTDSDRSTEGLSPRVTVGIAVVELENRYLVGIRNDDAPLPGLSEFPGGKCRPGESPRDCAVRECREETGLEVAPIELLLEKSFQYDHAQVELHFWRCQPESVTDIADEHRGFRWIPAAELATLQFPEANTELIALLASR